MIKTGKDGGLDILLMYTLDVFLPNKINRTLAIASILQRRYDILQSSPILAARPKSASASSLNPV